MADRARAHTKVAFIQRAESVQQSVALLGPGRYQAKYL